MITQRNEAILKQILSKIPEDLQSSASGLFHAIEEANMDRAEPTIDLRQITVDELWLVLTDLLCEREKY